MVVHKGTQRIETNRLILRRFSKSDAHDMFHNWANDEDVTRFLTWEPHKTIEVTETILDTWTQGYTEENYYMWAIVPKDYGKVIGSISVGNQSDGNDHCEIGYCISKAYWGQGITTEAFQAVIQYLMHTVGYERIQAIHYVENAASGRVMEKAGLTYEGCMRHFHKHEEGHYYDCALYGIIREDL
ncbi:GNAT family N-acetyltransferase [Vallitalea pronyensis]|uniref:GNAT family N-acetyltransferase n=1 Tax=Vallitalea pronyensis TaxID=1348613 RepID=A0A8J8MKX0_9FIRM|nr:GNAT family N-acetyltransferase [Vallitalea pronyensis]QUI23747.1 GNAT family N-acetyltransferase [Vallitalea pronyensis]